MNYIELSAGLKSEVYILYSYPKSKNKSTYVNCAKLLHDQPLVLNYAHCKYYLNQIIERYPLVR